MKCPKCGYTSFDYLMECKKCGEILENSRRALNLKMTEPTIFINLEKESEPTFSNNDELKIAADLGKADLDESSADLLGDFQPHLGDLPVPPPVDIGADLKNDIQMDDFDLELDTLTPLSEELNPNPDENITFNGFAEGDNPKIDLGTESPTGNIADADLLETSSRAGDDTGRETATGDFNLDLELPFDFSDSTAAEQKSGDSVISEASGAGVVELNLEDDESLDKILADLGVDDDKK